MPDTRHERIEHIVEYLWDIGLYTMGNSVRALLEERDNLLEANEAFTRRENEKASGSLQEAGRDAEGTRQG